MSDTVLENCDRRMAMAPHRNNQARNGNSSNIWQILTPIIIALAVGGTAPWWWPRDPLPKPPETAQSSPVVVRRQTFLMDNQPGRIIILNHVAGNEYRAEESSSPWPWSGNVILDGGKLTSKEPITFRNSNTTMRIEGVKRSDGAIEVSYTYVTAANGSSADPRVDYHVWYPQ